MKVAILVVLALAAAPTAVPAQRSGAEIVKSKCAGCHESGKHGAPRIGDREAWIPRLKKGLDAAVLAAIRGHGSMPARGGLAELTDAEFRGAVLYLFDPSGPPPRPVAPAPLGPNQRLVDGTRVLLGMKQLRHGIYHVEITLRDDKTGRPIDDAEVDVHITNPVMGTDTRKLAKTATHGVASYGADFRVSGAEPHTISVQARIPGKALPIQASFDFRQ